MAAQTGPLLAEDGAFLWVQFRPEERRVTLHCTVRLDLPDRTQTESPVGQYCLNIEVARDFAKEIAQRRSLPILWEGAAFEADVSYHGVEGWLGHWVIRYQGFPLEEGGIHCRTEDAARTLVEADAAEHFFQGRIMWRDVPVA